VYGFSPESALPSLYKAHVRLPEVSKYQVAIFVDMECAMAGKCLGKLGMLGFEKPFDSTLKSEYKVSDYSKRQGFTSPAILLASSFS
jgi:hypothetical protein